MAKYTENFNLIKPDDEDYYDVADFNENMDIIDEALADSTGSTEMLKGIISGDGQGVRIIKSIQRKIGGNATKSIEINPVNPSRCIVLSERLHDTSSTHTYYSYSLTANSLNINVSAGSAQSCTIGFWIIEFY